MKSNRVLAAFVLLFFLACVPIGWAQQFGPWSAPVNLGPAINTTPYFEQAPAISKDGLSLYFHSSRPGGYDGEWYGGTDIYVSQRPSIDAPWGTPRNLGPSINTSVGEASPFLSADGHRLYFQSGRAEGGCGGADIYVSRRHNKRDDFDWQPPVNLGCQVNSEFGDQQPYVFEDETTGITTLYFSSNQGALGGTDIYASQLQHDETFGPAVLVTELSSPKNDGGLTIRRDGLEVIFASNRAGSLGTLGDDDLWVSTRASTSDPWSPPVNLGPVVNTVFTQGWPELSFDGMTLYFNCSDPTRTSFDVCVTTRTKLRE